MSLVSVIIIKLSADKKYPHYIYCNLWLQSINRKFCKYILIKHQGKRNSGQYIIFNLSPC